MTTDDKFGIASGLMALGLAAGIILLGQLTYDKDYEEKMTKEAMAASAPGKDAQARPPASTMTFGQRLYGLFPHRELVQWEAVFDALVCILTLPAGVLIFVLAIFDNAGEPVDPEMAARGSNKLELFFRFVKISIRTSNPCEPAMRYGLNLLLWTDTLHDGILPTLEAIKKIGYDAVEIPIFELDVEKYRLWGRRLDDLGLARTAVTIRTVEDNPISPDAAVRSRGVANTNKALDCAAASGCEALVGPYHSALGHFSGSGPTADEWKWGVDSMRQVAEHAEKCNVTLGIEYLNRFECYLLNTAADGARFCHEVGHPRCQMMYDTFHSNIEEKNTAAAIRAVSGCLAHVHISENDRSTPGQGDIRWAEAFDTLHEIGYNNLLVIEAFGLALDKIAAATKIWRRMYTSELQLATDGLQFMKQQVAMRWK